METMESFFSTIIVHDSGERNSIMFCCEANVTLHEDKLEARAEALAKLVDMPLMPYYRKLEYNGLDLS